MLGVECLPSVQGARIVETTKVHVARGLRASQRGMTLVEILIVMTVMALLMGGVVMGSGQLSGARLKRSATMISSAVRYAFIRATSTSKNVRLVFDFDKKGIFVEESDRPMLVQSKSPTGGAEAATDRERQATAEAERLLKGPQPARPKFKAVMLPGGMTSDGEKGMRKLERGIQFREFHALRDDDPQTEGRGYLYFWPGGLTERAIIQLRIGDSTEEHDTMTLLVAPLTGKVTVKSGPQALMRPSDDKEASDREDRGF